MSAADIFDDALTNDPEVKDEASNYGDQQEFDRDLDTPAGKDEPMSPQPDADMDDLFGDDKPADEVIHHQESVI